MIQKIQDEITFLNSLDEILKHYDKLLNRWSTCWSHSTLNDSLEEEKPTIFFWCASYRGGQKLLADVGETFGQDGWTSTRSGASYNWTKECATFKLYCSDAAKAPEEQAVPVRRNEWPVLLTDRSEASEQEDQLGVHF